MRRRCKTAAVEERWRTALRRESRAGLVRPGLNDARRRRIVAGGASVVFCEYGQLAWWCVWMLCSSEVRIEARFFCSTQKARIYFDTQPSKRNRTPINICSLSAKYLHTRGTKRDTYCVACGEWNRWRKTAQDKRGREGATNYNLRSSTRIRICSSPISW